MNASFASIAAAIETSSGSRKPTEVRLNDFKDLA